MSGTRRPKPAPIMRIPAIADSDSGPSRTVVRWSRTVP